jgi:hypothetical protein
MRRKRGDGDHKRSGSGSGGVQGKKKPRQGFQAMGKAGRGGYVLS